MRAILFGVYEALLVVLLSVYNHNAGAVLALCFEKLERAAKVFTFIGGLSLELYMCHTYVYILLGHLYVHFCKPISWMIVFIISGILAYCFHLVNKKVLQRLF